MSTSHLCGRSYGRAMVTAFAAIATLGLAPSLHAQQKEIKVGVIYDHTGAFAAGGSLAASIGTNTLGLGLLMAGLGASTSTGTAASLPRVSFSAQGAPNASGTAIFTEPPRQTAGQLCAHANRLRAREPHLWHTNRGRIRAKEGIPC